MKVIINKEQKEIPVSFEGNDYFFAAGEPAQVEDNLFEHLKELLPMSFDFKPNLSKLTVVNEVKKTPTKVVFPGGKFGMQSATVNRVNFPNADELPNNGQTDKDGVEFYGEGLEDDSA